MMLACVAGGYVVVLTSFTVGVIHTEGGAWLAVL